MENTIVFKNGTLITPAIELKGDLVVKNGIISEVRDNSQIETRDNDKIKKDEEVIDCTGAYVGPGLVDIHVHGGAGNDFVCDDPQEIARGAAYHLSQGITSIVPSALSVPFIEIEKSIKATIEASKSKGTHGSNIIGYHIEGVYLDQQFRGGHLEEYVHEPDPGEYLPFIEKYGDFITEWTLAPELPGSIELIKACKQAGIVTSAGHTQATYDQMMAAIEAGLSHSTHFVCCMGSIKKVALKNGTTGKGYYPGVVEAVLLDDRISTETIADGFHLHKAIISLVYKCKGAGKTALVSDSMKGVGLPDGKYFIGGQDCIVAGGIAIIADRPETIASSVTPLIGMLRNANKEFGISLTDAWTMASLTPASIIGIDSKKGSLAVGKDADILIIDKDLNIKSIYLKGKLYKT